MRMDRSTKSDAFGEINGRPLRHTDADGAVHACAAADISPGVQRFWTLCKHEIAASWVWTSPFEFAITCPNCRRLDGDTSS